MNAILEAGLPVPPKSACFFCPFKSRMAWRDLKREQPELFETACRVEQHLDAKMRRAGHGGVLLTDSGVPLAVAVGEGVQMQIDDFCDSGWCFT